MLRLLDEVMNSFFKSVYLAGIVHARAFAISLKTYNKEFCNRFDKLQNLDCKTRTWPKGGKHACKTSLEGQKHYLLFKSPRY